MSTTVNAEVTKSKSGVQQFFGSNFFKRGDTTIFILVVAITLIADATLGDFRTLSNLSNLLNTVELIAIVAFGETVTILARQINSSVGAILGMCAFLVGEASGHVSGSLGPVFGVAMALARGAVLRLGTAFLIDALKMPAIIATLAIYTGIQILANKDRSLSDPGA
jgi:ribose/xylose/arabinose/galactoside ABC-type transport system permease subunit